MTTYKDVDRRWRYRFTFKGKRYSGSAPPIANRQKVAADLEREHLEKLRKNQYTGVMPTVKEFVTQFLEYQKARTKQLTAQLQRVHLEIHVVKRIGDKFLDDVGQRELDMLVTEWSKKAKPRTINSRLGTLMRMFAVAVEWKILPTLPKATFVKVAKDTPRFLTDIEAHQLLEAAHPRWRPMMLVALRTGLRIGELRGLQWGDVDFARSQLHVQRTDPGVAGMESNPPKGGRGRTVPLTPDALACLAALRELRQSKKARISADDWVWPGVDIWKDQRNRDRPRSEGGCVNAITAAYANSGIEERDGDRLGWHTLRHTYASWLVMRNVSLRVVQDLLGHASIRQTERYAHLAPNAQHHAAVARLDFALSPDASSQGVAKELGPGSGDANNS